MKKYNRKAKCPKCDCGKVSSHFYEKRESIWNGGYSIRYDFDVIRRVCSQCGYCWDELPIDSDDK